MCIALPPALSVTVDLTVAEIWVPNQGTISKFRSIRLAWESIPATILAVITMILRCSGVSQPRIIGQLKTNPYILSQERRLLLRTQGVCDWTTQRVSII
jgi:hypothetical protein